MSSRRKVRLKDKATIEYVYPTTLAEITFLEDGITTVEEKLNENDTEIKNLKDNYTKKADMDKIANLDSNNVNIGNINNSLKLNSLENPTLTMPSGTHKLFHEGNTKLLLDLFYPVNIGMYVTATNVNPSTFLGGTWELVSGGKYLATVGTGTDKNGNTLTITEGENEGLYKNSATLENGYAKISGIEASQSINMEQTSVTDYESNISVTATSSSSLGITTGNGVKLGGNTGDMDTTNCSYGVYVWKRIG